jgi:hypothetical protein
VPAVPAVAQEASTAKAPKPFPYDDPSTAVLLWHQKMRHNDFVTSIRMGLTMLRDQHPDDFKTVLDEVTGQ